MFTGRLQIFSVETDSIVDLQKFCLLLKRELGCEVAILKLDPTTKDSIELASSRPGEVKLDFWYLSTQLSTELCWAHIREPQRQ